MLGNHFGESSECEEHADDRHDLRQIKEEYALERVFGTVPKFSDEKDRCERRETEVADESVHLHERRAGDVEDDEVRETEERVDEGEGYDRGGVRIRAFRIGIGDAERKVRGLAVDLPADEGSEVSDDSREEEREHDRIQVFSQRKFVFLQLMDEDEEESKRSSGKREVVVGSQEEPEESVGNHVAPFREEEKQPGEDECRQKERERVSNEEIRVDSEFSGKLVEHSEKEEERYRQRDSEGIDGDSERKFDLRVHAGF